MEQKALSGGKEKLMEIIFAVLFLLLVLCYSRSYFIAGGLYRRVVLLLGMIAACAFAGINYLRILVFAALARYILLLLFGSFVLRMLFGLLFGAKRNLIGAMSDAFFAILFAVAIALLPGIVFAVLLETSILLFNTVRLALSL